MGHFCSRWANKYSRYDKEEEEEWSGCIITTTESIRLSGRVNILGTVGLREEYWSRKAEEIVTLYPTAPLETVKTRTALGGRGT